MMIEVTQYEKEGGECPFADWFLELDTRAALKVRTTIARMESGNLGDVKSVGGGDIERAQAYWADYQRRKQPGG